MLIVIVGTIAVILLVWLLVRYLYREPFTRIPQLLSSKECDHIIKTIKNPKHSKRWDVSGDTVDNDPVWEYHLDKDYDKEMISMLKANPHISKIIKKYVKKKNIQSGPGPAMFVRKYSRDSRPALKKHSDVCDESLIIHLSNSDDYKGGDLVYYNHFNDKNSKLITRAKGEGIHHDKTLFHEVLPMHSGERYTLIFFLYAEPIKDSTAKTWGIRMPEYPK